MRFRLILKTIFRSSLNTLLIFLLLASASYALFSRVADYAVVNREMQKATSYYRGIALLDTGVVNTSMIYGSYLPLMTVNEDPRNPTSREAPVPISAEQITSFSNLEGVSATDTRYMTAGFVNDVIRVARYEPYFAGYDYTDRFIIEGTFAGVNTIATGVSGDEKQLFFTDIIN
jgi:hypothetical protein